MVLKKLCRRTLVETRQMFNCSKTCRLHLKTLNFPVQIFKGLGLEGGIEIYDLLKIIEHKACLCINIFVMCFKFHIHF